MSKAATNGVSGSRNYVIDTIRFLSILFIYVFHAETAAGGLYNFFGKFHVAIFFMLSGFWALNHPDWSLTYFLKNAVKKYLFSWFLWVCIYTVFYAVTNDLGVRDTLDVFIRYFSAIRATGIWGMWFTPAFFFVCFIYFLLLKLLLKCKILSVEKMAFINLIIAFIIYFTFRYILKNPQGLLFSLSFVPEYLFYYSLGTVVYKVVMPIFQEKVSECRKPYYICGFGFLSITYSAMVYFQKDSLIWSFSKTFANGFLTFLPEMLVVIFAFMSTAIVAKLICCKFTADIGRNTLGLCHAEMLIKKSIIGFGGLFGLTVSQQNPIQAIIFSLLSLVIGNKLILPITERIKIKTR